MYPSIPSYTNAGYQEQPYPPGFNNQPPPPAPPPPPYYTTPEVVAAQPYPYPQVVTTTQYVVAMPQPVYRDYMGLSILNTLLCCLPLGIAAWCMSCKSRDSLRCGETLLATHYSASARRLNIVGIVLGCCGHVAWIAYVIYYNSTWNYSYNYNWYG